MKKTGEGLHVKVTCNVYYTCVLYTGTISFIWLRYIKIVRIIDKSVQWLKLMFTVLLLLWFPRRKSLSFGLNVCLCTIVWLALHIQCFPASVELNFFIYGQKGVKNENGFFWIVCNISNFVFFLMFPFSVGRNWAQLWTSVYSLSSAQPRRERWPLATYALHTTSSRQPHPCRDWLHNELLYWDWRRPSM